MKPHELINQRFGRLFVTKKIGPNKHKNIVWECKCDCGKIVQTAATNLISGKSKSCGCLGAENRLKAVTKHRALKTPEYSVWRGMRARCLNKNSTNYPDYGGRGIKICERWNNFLLFLNDVGEKPGPEYSLDRIDVNGNYEPSNCKWATKKEQARNKRKKIFAGSICCPNCKVVFNPYEQK